jgi:hypothetical protein
MGQVAVALALSSILSSAQAASCSSTLLFVANQDNDIVQVASTKGACSMQGRTSRRETLHVKTLNFLHPLVTHCLTGAAASIDSSADQELMSDAMQQPMRPADLSNDAFIARSAAQSPWVVRLYFCLLFDLPSLHASMAGRQATRGTHKPWRSSVVSDWCTMLATTNSLSVGVEH